MTNNYAFIDSQNLNLGIDWDLDHARFRVYLKEKYGIVRAFMFLGYIERLGPLYRRLERAGFELVFKEVTRDQNGRIKGNVDVDMTLYTLVTLDAYDKAVLVTSDGDFAPLVQYLLTQDKLHRVLSPKYRTCSWLLRKHAKSKIDYIDTMEVKLKKHP